MSRAIDGTKRKNRRAKILKLASGFTGRRGTNYKAAKERVDGLLLLPEAIQIMNLKTASTTTTKA